LLLANVFLREQNRLVQVEARNSVLQIWAPTRADGASGATGYLRVNTDSKVAGFVLGRVSGERKVSYGEGPRVRRRALRSSGRAGG
jgi:hypothetical protein